MSQLYERAKALGTFAQNVKWFTPDYTPLAGTSRTSDLIIQINASSSVIVEVTVDGGNVFNPINSGLPVPVGFSQFDIFATKDDRVNLRTTDPGGISVDCRLINDLTA